jgi:hypothetical protein
VSIKLEIVTRTFAYAALVFIEIVVIRTVVNKWANVTRQLWGSLLRCHDNGNKKPAGRNGRVFLWCVADQRVIGR